MASRLARRRQNSLDKENFEGQSEKQVPSARRDGHNNGIPAGDAQDDGDLSDYLKPVDSTNHLVKEIASIYVPHTRFVSTLDRVMRAIDSLYGCGPEPKYFSVGGPSGVGKSTLLRKLDARYPPRPDAIEIRHPLLGHLITDHKRVGFVTMPSSPTVPKVLERMLKALGDPFWYRRSNAEARLGLLIERMKLKAFIFDEAQRLADRSGTVRAFEIIETLRDLAAEYGFILVLVGLGRMAEITRQDDQFSRRFDAEIRLDPFFWLNTDGFDNVRDQEEFFAVVSSLKNALPASLGEDLNVDDPVEAKALLAARRFFYASQGVFGRLTHLLQHCGEILGSPALCVLLPSGWGAQAADTNREFAAEVPILFRVGVFPAARQESQARSVVR